MLKKRNFYINGKWVEPKNSKDIQVINPATEKSCAVISLGGKADVDDAVSAAKTAFQTWGFTKKEERIKLLEKFYEFYIYGSSNELNDKYYTSVDCWRTVKLDQPNKQQQAIPVGEEADLPF